MTGQELLDKIKEDESSVPNGYLIVNGATAHEFMNKWDEFIKKYSDRKTVWSELFILFDLEYIPLED